MCRCRERRDLLSSSARLAREGKVDEAARALVPVAASIRADVADLASRSADAFGAAFEAAKERLGLNR